MTTEKQQYCSMIQFAKCCRTDIAQIGEDAGKVIPVAKPAHFSDIFDAVFRVTQQHTGLGNPAVRQKILRRHAGLFFEQARKSILAHSGDFRQSFVGNLLLHILLNKINRINHPAVIP